MFTPVVTCHLPPPYEQYVLAYGTLPVAPYCQPVGAIRLLTPEGAVIPMQMRVRKTLRQITCDAAAGRTPVEPKHGSQIYHPGTGYEGAGMPGAARIHGPDHQQAYPGHQVAQRKPEPALRYCEVVLLRQARLKRLTAPGSEALMAAAKDGAALTGGAPRSPPGIRPLIRFSINCGFAGLPGPVRTDLKF